MVGVSASVNLPLHYKVQKFSSGTGLPGWSRKKGRKTVVAVAVSGNILLFLFRQIFAMTKTYNSIILVPARRFVKYLDPVLIQPLNVDNHTASRHV